MEFVEIRNIDTDELSYLESVEGTDRWYYSMSFPDGDMYEAEELYASGVETRGTDLLFIHYPDGRSYRPAERKKNTCLGRPVFHEGMLSFLAVDFEEGTIKVFSFNCRSHRTYLKMSMSLKEVRNCYNLILHGFPLTLTRQGNEGIFEIIWPERTSFELKPNESFAFRNGDRLYFSAWYEDPDYREETIVRDLVGNKLETMPGDVRLMPDGTVWHIG